MEKQMENNRISLGDYMDAILIQDACNLSGVVGSFARVIKKIWAEARATDNGSTEWVNRHPISVLYSSKISSLSGSEDMESFSEAYDACQAELKKCG